MPDDIETSLEKLIACKVARSCAREGIANDYLRDRAQRHNEAQRKKHGLPPCPPVCPPLIEGETT